MRTVQITDTNRGLSVRIRACESLMLNSRRVIQEKNINMSLVLLSSGKLYGMFAGSERFDESKLVA